MAVEERDELLLEFISMANAVAKLPSPVLEELAVGPWPEPHCGVCRALDRLFVQGPIEDDDLCDAVLLVIDWHDEPLRRRSRRYNGALGEECYYRCLAVYAAAKVALGA